MPTAPEGNIQISMHFIHVSNYFFKIWLAKIVYQFLCDEFVD